MWNNAVFTRFPYSALNNVFRLLLALCTASFAVSIQALESQTVTIDAPGADLTPGNYNGTFPTAINAFGTIAGFYEDVSGAYHGFVLSPNGKFRQFDAPGADLTPGVYHGTLPLSINDAGAVSGWYSDAAGVSHGFFRSPDGAIATFDVPGSGGYGTTPVALNFEGAVVGYYTDPNYVFYAFQRYPDGTFKSFSGPEACDTSTATGCYGNEATAISIFGTIVGNYMDANFIGHSFIRDAHGRMKVFDAPGAGSTPGSYQGTGCPGCFAGFNLRGAVAATYADSNSVSHGFLRNAQGEFTTFDAPGAGTGSYQGTGCFSDCSVSLNNLGVIIGTYIDSNFNYHGYLRSPNGKIKTIDPKGATYTSANGLNDAGVAVGYYLDGNNVYHGFIRIPD